MLELPRKPLQTASISDLFVVYFDFSLVCLNLFVVVIKALNVRKTLIGLSVYVKNEFT